MFFIFFSQCLILEMQTESYFMSLVHHAGDHGGPAGLVLQDGGGREGVQGQGGGRQRPG